MLLQGAVIAFEGGNGGAADVYLLDVRLRVAHNLTRTTAYNERLPTWSPNGRLLAFQRERDPTTTAEAIFVLDIYNRGRVGRLQTGSGRAIHPAWSPDGCCIAFSMYTQQVASNNIHILDLQTGDVWNAVPSRLITQFLPAWSPDGTRLVFNGTRLLEGIEPKLFIAQPLRQESANNAAVIKQLADTESVAQPDWFPNGTHMVQTNLLSTGGLQILPVDDTAAEPSTILDDIGSIEHPSVSPDGERLVFSVSALDGSGTRSLYIANIDGSGYRRLTVPQPGRTIDNAPAWMPPR